MSDYLATARAFVSRRLDEENERDEETASSPIESGGPTDLRSFPSFSSSPSDAFEPPRLDGPVGDEVGGELVCPTARSLPLTVEGAATAAAWAEELDRHVPEALATFIDRHTILKAAVREVLYRRALRARAQQLEHG